MSTVEIRPYTAEDLATVAGIFTSSVHELAASDYTPQQLDAWAARPPLLARWAGRLLSMETMVATVAAKPAGFIAYTPVGYIDLLYISPAYARRGVASSLYEFAERALTSAGVRELLTDASLVARPFFERFGFLAAQEQDVLAGGCSLRRYAMRKTISRP